jgi:hypothetical protein
MEGQADGHGLLIAQGHVLVGVSMQPVFGWGYSLILARVRRMAQRPIIYTFCTCAGVQAHAALQENGSCAAAQQRHPPQQMQMVDALGSKPPGTNTHMLKPADGSTVPSRTISVSFLDI